MPKTIFTDHDIEDQAKQGIRVIQLNDDVVLTDLAYEKAQQLGIELMKPQSKKPANALAKGRSPQLTGKSIEPVQEIFQRDILGFGPDASESQLRDAVIETGRILYAHGLMISNDGNISVRMADGNILITPSGVCKGRINAGDLLVVSPDGKVVKVAQDASMKPTSEQSMHLEVYRQRSDVRAVIHTHLIFANALAISQGRVRMDVIPEAAIAFGEIPVTDFALPSSPQNADAIRNLIRDHDVMLIRNHGSLAVGKNLDEALIHQERLEHISKTLTFAELMGNINALPPNMMEAIQQIVVQSKRKS